jgi:hypothetical protein
MDDWTDPVQSFLRHFSNGGQTKETVDVRGHINYFFYLNTVAKKCKNE